MKVNVTRGNCAITKIGNRNSGRNLTMLPVGNFDDAALFDEHDRVLDTMGRSEQSPSGESQHRNVLIAAKDDYGQ
jgi:hypothetical protein